MDELLQAAADRGVLPAGAALPPQESRPWPVVLLIALGAWLAAVPLLGVAGLLLGGLIANSAGAYFVGVLLLAAAVVLLRARELPTFVEQLAMPALVVGGGCLAMAFFRDLPDAPAAGLLCAVALGLCALLDRPWLRVLLGAAAAAAFMGVIVPFEHVGRGGELDSFWLALHGTLAAWAAALWLQQRVLASGERARQAALVESVAAGWLLPVLAGLAVQSGITMFVAGNLGGFRGIADGSGWSAMGAAMQAISFSLAAAAVVLAGRRWATLRRPAAALAGIVLAVLAFFLPALGAVLLALVLTATSQRWRLAGAAALAAAWIVGAFYYQLAWPLALKAIVLAAAGAALAAAAWWAGRGPRATGAAPAPQLRRGPVLVLVTAVLVLAAANLSIWQKERLIAQGDKVYVALAPVDPRSLMQGDFMRLAFNVPGAAAGELPPLAGGRRPHAVASRDARGVAQLSRIARPGEALAAGEFRIELTPKDGRWILVTDAWFFREGEAARFERARFGEFRVLPDGRALLVGLADDQLRPLQP
ncbi:GDYXXLXY domain-containing protein [Caenimonas sedimenti]|nr:GDYXXLXY domain-containing protein [Caenimonas sedimenti]